MKLIAAALSEIESSIEKEDDKVASEEAPQVGLSTTQGFTDEYLHEMNQVLAQQSLSAVLEWCCNSFPNFYQITSFGSAGMVVIHALHKLNLKVVIIIAFVLWCFMCCAFILYSTLLAILLLSFPSSSFPNSSLTPSLSPFLLVLASAVQHLPRSLVLVPKM